MGIKIIDKMATVEETVGYCVKCEGAKNFMDLCPKCITKIMDESKKEPKPTTKKVARAKKPDFERAFYHLMNYWYSIPDEAKPELDKKLWECGL